MLLFYPQLILFKVLVSLHANMAPGAVSVYGKGRGSIMTSAAIFPLPERCHGEIFFLFNLPCLLCKDLRVATLTVKIFAEMHSMLKYHGPHRF